MSIESGGFNPQEAKEIARERLESDAKMAREGADVTEKGGIDPSERQERIAKGDMKIDLMEGFSEVEESQVSRIAELAGIDRSQVSEALKSYKTSYRSDPSGWEKTKKVTFPGGSKVVMETRGGGPVEDRTYYFVDGKYVSYDDSNLVKAAKHVMNLREEIYGE